MEGIPSEELEMMLKDQTKKRIEAEVKVVTLQREITIRNASQIELATELATCKAELAMVQERARHREPCGCDEAPPQRGIG